jgi:hypothetical protein
VHLKTKLAKVRKDVVGARDEVITRVEEKRAIAKSLKGAASRLRFEFPPMVAALSWVMNSGLATPPGHCSVSIAACLMKRKSTGPSHGLCRAPMVLSTSEPSSPIVTLALAPKWSRTITSKK